MNYVTLPIKINTMKLSSFQGNNQLTITQSAHGVQNGCAFDFGWGGGPIDRRIYAPCDGTVYTHQIMPDGDQYFDFSSPDNGPGNNFYIQFVHDKPLRKGAFRRGELLGEWAGWTKDPHHHVALWYNGWRWIFDALDRNTNLYWWTYPNQNNKWAKWSTYPTDIQLPEKIIPPVETCEIKLAAANTKIAALEIHVNNLQTQLDKFKLIDKPVYEKIS